MPPDPPSLCYTPSPCQHRTLEFPPPKTQNHVRNAAHTHTHSSIPRLPQMAFVELCHILNHHAPPLKFKIPPVIPFPPPLWTIF